MAGPKVFFQEEVAEAKFRDVDPCFADHSRWSKWRLLNYSYLKESLDGLSEGAVVIDVGAGPGFFSDLLRPFSVCSLDIVPYPNVDVVCDLASQRLPIIDQVADVVLLSNVLEHLERPEDTLKECWRTLRPGGLLLITVPFLVKIHQAPHDYYRFTHYRLEGMLRDAGFVEMRCRKLGNLFDILASIRWELGRLSLARTRQRWLVRLLQRIEYNATERALRWSARLSDEYMADQDFFVGYGCRAAKAFRGDSE